MTVASRLGGPIGLDPLAGCGRPVLEGAHPAAGAGASAGGARACGAAGAFRCMSGGAVLRKGSGWPLVRALSR